MLVVFLLQANLAWAADVHEAMLAPSSDHFISIASAGHVDGTGQHKDHGVTPCDHCCHASSHFAGMPAAVFSFSSQRCIAAGLLASAYRSRLQEPPLPPPNI